MEAPLSLEERTHDTSCWHKQERKAKSWVKEFVARKEKTMASEIRKTLNAGDNEWLFEKGWIPERAVIGYYSESPRYYGSIKGNFAGHPRVKVLRLYGKNHAICMVDDCNAGGAQIADGTIFVISRDWEHLQKDLHGISWNNELVDAGIDLSFSARKKICYSLGYPKAKIRVGLFLMRELNLYTGNYTRLTLMINTTILNIMGSQAKAHLGMSIFGMD